MTKEQGPLLTTDIVRSLINQGRIPTFIPVDVYNHASNKPGCTQDNRIREERFIVIVPPEDTQPGDILRSDVGGTFNVVSSTGQVRREPDYYFITPQEAEELKGK